MTRRGAIGLVVGAVAGGGTVIAGPTAGLLGLIAIALAVVERPRVPTIGGVLIGLGGAWLALFGRVALTCRQECVAPDLGPWLVVAGVIAALGVLMTLRSIRPG